MRDEYKTLKEETRSELRVQGSRFLATALPTETPEAAEQFVEVQRKRYHDATHNCFAYRLGVDGGHVRFNDDGEPSGTAGKPILAALEKTGLTDVTVVVTRYFGGTKLGTGGLARAYGEVAEQALARGGIVTRHVMARIEASFPHSHTGHVMHVVSTVGARILETTYDEEVHLTLEIRASLLDSLHERLIESTSGNIRIR